MKLFEGEEYLIDKFDLDFILMRMKVIIFLFQLFKNNEIIYERTTLLLHILETSLIYFIILYIELILDTLIKYDSR